MDSKQNSFFHILNYTSWHGSHMVHITDQSNWVTHSVMCPIHQETCNLTWLRLCDLSKRKISDVMGSRVWVKWCRVSLSYWCYSNCLVPFVREYNGGKSSRYLDETAALLLLACECLFSSLSDQLRCRTRRAWSTERLACISVQTSHEPQKNVQVDLRTLYLLALRLASFKCSR